MIPARPKAATLWFLSLTLLLGCTVKSTPVDEPDDDRQRGRLLVHDKGSSDYAINATVTSIVKSSGFAGSKPRGLLIRPVSGGKFRPLLTGSGHLHASGPQWMDATHIAFVDPGKSRDSKRSTLWIANVNGTASEVPNAVVGGEEWEAWTVRDIVGANSTTIYFVAGKVIGSGRELVSIRADGSARTVIANLYDEPTRFNVAVSPDGERAVWTQESAKQDFDNRNDVVVGNLDGSGAVVLGRGQEPAWSPDGKSVVYLAKAGREEEDGLPLLSVHTVSASGSAKPQIQDGGYCCWAGRVQWVGKNTIVLSDAAYVVGDGRLYSVKLK